MRKVLSIIWFLLLVPSVALAQDKTESRGHGYVFAAPGGTAPSGPATLHFGGGGEGFVYKGLAVGRELGYLAAARDLGTLGVGVFSANGSYHFQPKQKLDPFVTAGYSLVFREGTANFFNFGGGANYWMRDGMALRLEFRDHVNTGYGTIHYLGFRVGLTFR